jgi:hypothetical protein
LKPIKVRSEAQAKWSRELGKRNQEFKTVKRQQEQELEELIINEDPENRDQPRYWLIGGIVALIIGGGVYFYKFKLRSNQPVEPEITHPKMTQSKILNME